MEWVEGCKVTVVLPWDNRAGEQCFYGTKQNVLLLCMVLSDLTTVMIDGMFFIMPGMVIVVSIGLVFVRSKALA